MKALIWIIIVALIVWGIWWFMHRNTPGVPATGDTSGQVEGTSDTYNGGAAGDAGVGGSTQVDVKG